MPLRNLAAAYELIARAGLSHVRPAFGIDKVIVGNREVAVREEVALSRRSARCSVSPRISHRPARVLLVAPLSGHFATPAARTVETLLRDHDVYITDWNNARDVTAQTGTSASTIMSTMSSDFWRSSARAPISSPCASPVCRPSWPSR